MNNNKLLKNVRKNTQPNKMIHLMQNLEAEFNKEVEMVKRTQIEMKTQLKNSSFELEIPVNVLHVE